MCTYVVLGVLLPVILGCPFRFLMPNFKSLNILNVNVFAHKTETIFTDCNWVESATECYNIISTPPYVSWGSA
jgi:hypothetical protein